MNLKKTLIPVGIGLLCLAVFAIAKTQPFSGHITAHGNRYDYLNGGKNHPLALIFTTNIKESLTDVYTPIGSMLRKAGFTVASVDVTCHGRDVKKGEPEGLQCWQIRADKSKGDIFAPMLAKVSDVITDMQQKDIASSKYVVAIGVSRGGYIALRAAAQDPRIKMVVAMSPVTDLKRLQEFDHSKVNEGVYGLEKDYMILAKKHIFMQIGNEDDRVGTVEALRFENGVVKAGGDKPVDLTMVITPNKGHGTAMHDVAAQWVLHEISSGTKDSHGLAAPK